MAGINIFSLKMRLNTIINRYIFRELIPPFAITLLFLTFIFLMTRIPQITNMVVNYNTKISDILMLIFYTLPRFVEFTIPMSVMISVLLCFMRMSQDNEIIALKAGGVVIYRLIAPVLLFCFTGTVVTLWITLCAKPWGNIAIADQGVKIARSSFNIALKERRFNNTFNGVMIYVNAKDIKTKQLKDVYIEDSRINGKISVSVAPRGAFFSDSRKMSYTLRLYNGMVNQVDLKTESVNCVYFTTYDINLNLNPARHKSEKKSKNIDEMSFFELVKFSGKKSADKKLLNSALMELHEKLSIPFACIALGILSFALGLQAGNSRRSSGLGLGLFFFFLYYLLLAVGWSLGKYRFYPPVVGMWLPDFIMGFAGIYMLKRIANERPFRVPGFLSGHIAFMKKISSRSHDDKIIPGDEE